MKQLDIDSPLLPVSVVIPCYNSTESIERSVSSVLKQTCRPRQLILVDDASTDDGCTLSRLYTLKNVARELIPAIDVVPLSANGGPAYARNVGWERASQDYVAFLDADDAWHPDKLRLQYHWMRQNPAVVMSGHQSRVLNDGRRLPDTPEAYLATLITPGKLLLKNLFPTRTVMLRRDLPLRFDPCLRRAEDYHLWLRIVLGGFPAWRLESPLAYSFKEDYGVGGLSASLWKMEKAELHAFIKIHREGLVSLPVLCAIAPLSFIKFLRRLMFSRVLSRG